LDTLDTDSELLFEQESHIKEIRVKVDQIVSIVTEVSTILSKLAKKICNKGVKRKNKHRSFLLLILSTAFLNNFVFLTEKVAQLEFDKQ
jgi:hypothetical protein